jgi:hypothetical protein
MRCLLAQVLRYYESVEIKIKYYAKAVTITNGLYTMLGTVQICSCENELE